MWEGKPSQGGKCASHNCYEYIIPVWTTSGMCAFGIRLEHAVRKTEQLTKIPLVWVPLVCVPMVCAPSLWRKPKNKTKGPNTSGMTTAGMKSHWYDYLWYDAYAL